MEYNHDKKPGRTSLLFAPGVGDVWLVRMAMHVDLDACNANGPNDAPLMIDDASPRNPAGCLDQAVRPGTKRAIRAESPRRRAEAGWESFLLRTA